MKRVYRCMCLVTFVILELQLAPVHNHETCTFVLEYNVRPMFLRNECEHNRIHKEYVI